MSYIPSVNIEFNTTSDFQYIITENSRMVASNIVNGFNSGHHSFSIIGTYGTGKSSFILALEDDLVNDSKKLINKKVLSNVDGFQFLNIVGDYSSLGQLLAHKLNCSEDEVINVLNQYYQLLKTKNQFLVIVIDEFGKVLEYSSNHNPEKELYFLQKLSEYVNVPSRNIILITTLHQNFGSYGLNLDENQRKEWQKVKGRFQEIVFAEPVEQLLDLTAQQLKESQRNTEVNKETIDILYELGIQSKIINKSLSLDTVERLYPLDPISAVCLTLAMQRYGQNERSLFSFLTAKGDNTLLGFKSKVESTYNLANLYDYLTYHFYTSINEMNSDTTGWRALAVAIERVEGSSMPYETIEDCRKLIKSIGIVNIFFKGIVLDDKFLITYGKHALGISNPKDILNILENLKVIRFAKYKSQYILFEGTNLDIEQELYKAASVVPIPQLTAEEILPYFKPTVEIANAVYYRTGTPRYFEYKVVNEPTIIEPTGNIDGYIYLIFPLSDIEREVEVMASHISSGASLYGYFHDTQNIVKHLYEIKKLQYVIENVAFDDRVALSELNNQKNYEKQILNESINKALIKNEGGISWYFQGRKISINSIRDLNKILSHICDVVYHETPVIRNELFNRQKLSSAISLARVNLLDAMLNHSDEKDFGIMGFPPEKTIYYTLFFDSGIHRQNEYGEWILGQPSAPQLQSLWKVSEEFISSSIEKPLKLSELANRLRCAPYKLKQGVIDFWIPIFLFLNQQKFALYNRDTFVLNINKEVFELVQKRIADFSIKAYKVEGIKLEFFKRYRQFLRKDDTLGVSSDSLMETVKPFFHFYKNLNTYAKHTRKFDNAYTAKFRDVLSNAQDPSKTFFEDLPAALGYRELGSEEFVQEYLELIKRAVRELNSCYDNLINRIEENVVRHLGLPSDFQEYKSLLNQRYNSIDTGILTPKMRSFLNRIMGHAESKNEFFEKLTTIITDKRLEELKDSEEPQVLNQLRHMFSELERLSAISVNGDLSDGTEAFNFELASSNGNFSSSKTYRLPKSKSEAAAIMAEQIKEVLSDNDEDLNICVLLKILNEKV